MNYLAHALLSPEDHQVLMGNLWGDLLKPRDFEQLEKKVVSGVMIHRKIDAFTDQHDKVGHLMKLLRPFQGKYTPVVADVLMDFMLSKYWKDFHKSTVERFCQDKYKIVKKHLDLIPERLHPRIQRMLENHWLESCKNRQRMQATLHMLSMRASFENKIPEAMQAYDLHEEKMDELFLSFFEDLRSHITLQNEGLS
jgi:acyl carrier protein phosphodiesterase